MMRDYIKSLFSKKNLLNNLKEKILSLAIAFGVWIAVVSITDPIVSQPYRNVTVRLVNTAVVSDNGETLEILEGTDTIPVVNVKAPRSIIRELGTGSDSIIATADFSKLTDNKSVVPIELSAAKYNDKIDDIRTSDDKLLVKIEKKKSVQLPIQTTTSGEIESGYILGNSFLSQNQVKVSGPESVIEEIKAAKVDVLISGFTENITTQSDIVLYNQDGDAISKERLELNADSVKVTVEILETKRVKISYDFFGNPAEEYAVTGEKECNPESVVIAGPSADIANISAITIPSSEINITGQTSNYMAMIDLNKFLPDNTRFADSSFNGKVSVKIFIEKIVEDNFGVDPHEIEIKGIPEGFKAEFEEGEVYEYTLKGLAQDLERISLDTVNYYVDFEDYIKENPDTELQDGVYELKLYFDIPENVTLDEDVIIKVRLFE